MGTGVMGRVTIEATVENLKDLWAVEQGFIPPEQVRRIILSDALVDTGATHLGLPLRLITELGLSAGQTRRLRTAAGIVEGTFYNAVRLTIQGRDCVADVLGLPDDAPPLIGQVPLELLDFVVDPKNQRLIGNPEHGGEWMADLY